MRQMKSGISDNRSVSGGNLNGVEADEVPFPIAEHMYDIFRRCKEQYALNNSALEMKFREYNLALKKKKETFKPKSNSNWIKIRGLFRAIFIIKSGIFKKKLYGSTIGLDRFSINISYEKKLKIYRWISGWPDTNIKTKPRKWYILYDESLFLKIWSFIMMILFSYTVIYLPYKISFLEESNGFFLSLDWVVNIAFMVDIAVSMISQYNDGGEQIDDVKMIVKNYLQTWFLFDFISIIPFEYFLQENIGFGVMVKFTRILKIIKVFRLVKISGKISKNRYLRKVTQFFNINRQFSEFILFFFFIILITHITGCLWYFITKVEDSDHTWISAVKYDKYENVDIYVMSIYWAISTICTVGFGDIVPISIVEKLFNLIWICVGIAFYSYTIGALSAILNASNLQKSIISSRFAFLHEYSKEKKIDKSLLEKITINLEFLEESKQFMQNEISMNFLQDISLNLTYDIAKHIHKELIEKVVMFQNKDVNFVAQIIPYINTRKFRAGDVIYNMNEYPLFVYFLTSGKAGFSENYNRFFKIFVQGSYFGEIEIFKSCLRNNKVTALTDCTILLLPRENFIQELQNFPEIFEELLLTAIKRDILNKKNSKYVDRMHKMNMKTIGDPTFGDQFKSLQSKAYRHIVDMKNEMRKLVMEYSQGNEVNREIKFSSRFASHQHLKSDSSFDKNNEDLLPPSISDTTKLESHFRSVKKRFETLNNEIVTSRKEVVQILTTYTNEKLEIIKNRDMIDEHTQFNSLEKSYSASTQAEILRTPEKPGAFKAKNGVNIERFRLDLKSLESFSEKESKRSEKKTNFIRPIYLTQKDLFESSETRDLNRTRNDPGSE